MVSYSDVKTEYDDNWNTSVIQKPTFVDKDLQYSLKYPHFFFIKVYDNMDLKPISQSNDGGLVKRKQFFQVYGVYDTYANAKLALQECKRIVTEKNGWYIMGKSMILQNRERFIFNLPCYELAYLQKSEW